ncbi:hypothetical protein BD289DRAFT_435512, partial [Coniella lustricola]
MNIDPPMSADEVPAVIEKVKAKLDHWKSDQTAQTQRVSFLFSFFFPSFFSLLFLPFFFFS